MKYSLVTFWWCVLASVALAEPATVPLGLDQAEQLMRANSPVLKAAGLAVEAAGADLVTAGERPNPLLSVNSSSINPKDSNGPGSLWDKQIDTVFQLQQQLERGGKRQLRQKAAESGRLAASADYADAWRTGRLALNQAYYDLKFAQDAEQIAQRMLDLQQQSLRTTQVRQQAGDASAVDVARLEIEVSKAAADLRTAQTNRLIASHALTQLIGNVTGTVAVASDDWPAAQAPQPSSSTLDQRPDIIAASARRDQAVAGIDLASAQQTRDVTVSLQYERNPQPNSPSNTVGIGFSVPLFLNHRYEGEVERAHADRLIAEEALRNARLTALTEQASAQAKLDGARDRVQQFETSIIDKANTTAQAAEFAYGRGAMNLTDLLDARRALQSVLLDALSARLDYAKALAAWKAATDTTSTPVTR